MVLPDPSTCFQFHVSVHAQLLDASAGEGTIIRGVAAHPLKLSSPSLPIPLGISFEEASERLEQLPRMFLEPDGSFVWVSSSQDDQWQVDGVLYDRDGHLMFVDLKGTCPELVWNELLLAIGSDRTPLMFQLVREALFLDDTEFRKVSRKPMTG